MEISIRPVWAEIDLNLIENNIREIKKSVPNKEVIAVIKADAYGHGAIDIAPVLLKNGADKLAVAVITEALQLRNNNVKAPILILGYTPVSFIKDIVEKNIQQTVYSYEYAKELSSAAAELNAKVDIHIALDTGMGRIGFLLNDDSIRDIENINRLENINITGVFTHFSSADEEDKGYTKYQIEEFNKFTKELEARGINLGCKHASNSAGILDLKEAHLDAVRPGIILYGYYPSNEVIKEKIRIKPSLTLKSQIVHVKELPEGKYISYGRKFKTERKSIIATLPIGYADGYSRALYNKAKVIINGKLVPVVGRICMDQCMIDVTDIGEVNVGDEVILLGEDNNTVFNADTIAELLDTINYEVLCTIGRRVPRVYKNNEEIIKTRNYL